MVFLIESLAAAQAAVGALPVDSANYGGLSDAELLDSQAKLADLRRHLDACAAATAGEIARRSRHEFGYAGLAQRTGYRTPEALVQHVTRSTGREASALVRIGTVMQQAQAAEELLAEAEASKAQTPGAQTPGAQAAAEFWLTPVGGALADGTLSVAAADAIRAGLGAPSEDVSTTQLREAAADLVQLSLTLDADRLFKRARALRDDLDAAGIADRERARRQRRYLRLLPLPDGMVKLTGLLDPESAALVTDAFDLVTSPRRGGPRFVDTEEKRRADRIAGDERSTEQIMLDSLVEMIRIAGEADTGIVFGRKRPAVRVLVTAQALKDGKGFGRIDAQADPVSIETVERFACTAGVIPIVFDDDGQCLNIGREQRLFTARQRVALATRDGGCRWRDCTRPASWTEAHHIDHWYRDHGSTDVIDGVLLCRHHHMLLHNNHWEIVRRAARYLLIPPVSEDPEQHAIPLPSRSAALGDLLRQRRTG